MSSSAGSPWRRRLHWIDPPLQAWPLLSPAPQPAAALASRAPAAAARPAIPAASTSTAGLLGQPYTHTHAAVPKQPDQDNCELRAACVRVCVASTEDAPVAHGQTSLVSRQLAAIAWLHGVIWRAPPGGRDS